MALLEAGADVDAADRRGVTPLHYAAALGRRDAVHQLLARGANTMATDEAGATPLERAVAAGHDGIARILSLG